MALPANPSKAVVLLPLLLSLLTAVPPVSVKLKTSTITSNNELQVESPAAISNGALDQLTLHSAYSYGASSSFTNQSGQIPYDSYTGSVFTASFLGSTYRVDSNTPGEGLTFLLAPDLDVPPNSYGQYLWGLTNSTIDGAVLKGLMAVDFVFPNLA